MGEQIAGLVMLAFGLALVPALVLPLTRAAAEGRMERNGAAGIRTRHTRASDEAWRAGHAAALPTVRAVLPVTGLTYAGCAVALVLVGPGAATVVGLVGLGVQVTVLMLGVRKANEAARAVEA